MISAQLDAILKRYESSRVRRQGSVWHIEGGSAVVEECKEQILGAICADSEAYLRYDEAPQEIPEFAPATEVLPGTWRVPRGVRGGTLLRWLQPGNWQLYVADTPLPRIPDLCRASDLEVERFVLETRVDVIIDSFHDDVAWVVAWREGGRPSGAKPSIA